MAAAAAMSQFSCSGLPIACQPKEFTCADPPAISAIAAVGAGYVMRRSGAHAQDVRGLEVCTAEKQMDRRTGCLQANIDYLMNR